jgi:hypothetical protein
MAGMFQFCRFHRILDQGTVCYAMDREMVRSLFVRLLALVLAFNLGWALAAQSSFVRSSAICGSAVPSGAASDIPMNLQMHREVASPASSQSSTPVLSASLNEISIPKSLSVHPISVAMEVAACSIVKRQHVFRI